MMDKPKPTQMKEEDIIYNLSLIVWMVSSGGVRPGESYSVFFFDDVSPGCMRRPFIAFCDKGYRRTEFVGVLAADLLCAGAPVAALAIREHASEGYDRLVRQEMQAWNEGK